jgi:ABC-type multidrug transport system ATPase subunit
VLLTTQYLEEADRLARRIAVVEHGRIAAQGTPAELKATVGTELLAVRVATPRAQPTPRRRSPTSTPATSRPSTPPPARSASR